MKKKLFSLVMALCATTAVFAGEYRWKDGIRYWVSEAGRASVAPSYCSNMSSCSDYTIITANIPDSIIWKDGTITPVIGINAGAFRYCESITSVTIPKSIEYIGEYAFYDTNLKNVVFNAKRCSDIGSQAFSSSIESFTFGDEVEFISWSMFDDNKNITSISIPKSVKEISGNLGSSGSYITDFYYQGNVSNWGRINFTYYVNSESNPTSVRNKRVHIGSELSNDIQHADLDSIPYIGAYAFYNWSGLTSVTMGDSVTTIGERAFYGCSNLETVVFGENVQDIGNDAFYGCQNIYEMTVRAKKVPNVQAEGTNSNGYTYGTFQGVSKLAELHVPAESVKKYKIHPVWGLFDVITAIPCVVTLHCDNVMGAVTGAGSYQANEQVNITANPNLGYRFRQWSDGITTNPRTLVVVGDTTLTAEFEEIPSSEYIVSVVVDAEQNGAVQMTLTAVPDDGYQFTQWSDGNTDNPRTILVTENMTLSATFSVATNVAATPTHGDTTGTRKVIRNGHVLIQRDGKTYTIMGQDISKSTPSRSRAYGDPATR